MRCLQYSFRLLECTLGNSNSAQDYDMAAFVEGERRLRKDEMETIMKFVLLAFLSVFIAPAIADPIAEKAAIAEAMALLEPARLALDNAYKTNGDAFPQTSTFQVPLPSSAQHVKALSYASSGPGS